MQTVTDRKAQCQQQAPFRPEATDRCSSKVRMAVGKATLQTMFSSRFSARDFFGATDAAAGLLGDGSTGEDGKSGMAILALHLCKAGTEVNLWIAPLCRWAGAHPS